MAQTIKQASRPPPATNPSAGGSPSSFERVQLTIRRNLINIERVTTVPSRITSTSPLHEPRDLTEAERDRFRRIARAARDAKAAASKNSEPEARHPINVPNLNPVDLMPASDHNGMAALSLFSGGGGLDFGFERAGFAHVASYEVLEFAAQTLSKARPDWDVYGGENGDVRGVDWRSWRDTVDIVHGGPPCQPFSIAGRQRGSDDPRDMWPEFVRAITTTKPAAFVGENVPALASRRFRQYVEANIYEPLSRSYHVRQVMLFAPDYGVPQVRKRVFFVGFRSRRAAERWKPPAPTHAGVSVTGADQRPATMRVRAALGLGDIGFDDLSPTIRSTLNGPRNTTSILNSVAAQKRFAQLQIWPNGVALTREAAQAFPTPNGHVRLATPDVALIQGFPQDWPFQGAAYMILGQIGNAVPPPLAYAVASSVSDALLAR